jgi:hypothetical protein
VNRSSSGSATTHTPGEDWGVFRKSSFSESGNCVEVAFLRPPGGVLLRNSRHPESGNLEFTLSEWAAFLEGVRAGEFRHPGVPIAKG